MITKIIRPEQSPEHILVSFDKEIVYIGINEKHAKLIASAPELLEALIMDNFFPITTITEQNEAEIFAKKIGWKQDMPLEHFAQILRRNAIKKATE